MANLNVYSSDKSKDDRASDRTAATQVKPRKTKIQKDVEREPARDFFAMEDVHELTPGDGAVDMSYDEFNNDIEKIVMTDREEIVNPVQIDREDPVHKPVRKPAPVKRRKPVVVTPEEPKLAAVDTDMEDAEILSFTDDAEDVLAGAVMAICIQRVCQITIRSTTLHLRRRRRRIPRLKAKRSRRYRLRAQSSIRREENINSQRQICCPSLKDEQFQQGCPCQGDSHQA